MQGNIISQMNQAEKITAVSVQEQLMFESNLHTHDLSFYSLCL